MINKPNKTQNSNIPTQNPLEKLPDNLANQVLKSIQKDLVGQVSKDSMQELLGIFIPESPKISASFKPGESIEMNEILSEARISSSDKDRKKLNLERTLLEQEKELVRKRGEEIKAQVYILQRETEDLAKTTSALSEQVQTASSQAIVEPGIYHIGFLEKLIEFIRESIRSFRKKIDMASAWLAEADRRSAKKHLFWSQVKASGTKRLLSPEDYSQRSAG